MKQKIVDAILNKYYRTRLNILISGNINHLRLPTLGLKIYAAKKASYNNCKLTVRRILKTSINPDARKLFDLTINRNAKIDDIVTLAVSICLLINSKKYVITL